LNKLLLVLALVLGGCATSYQKHGLTGGYSEIQLAENVFEVNFSGNGYTGAQTVKQFTLYRSAELTLERGYKYFSIMGRDNFTKYGSGRIGDNVYPITKPALSNTIMMFKEKPTEIFSYEAAFIIQSINVPSSSANVNSRHRKFSNKKSPK